MTDTLVEGTRLVMPDPAFLLPIAFTETFQPNGAQPSFSSAVGDRFTRLLSEYWSIRSTIASVIGKENVVSNAVPFLKDRGRTWPRNAYTVLGDVVYANPNLWTRILPNGSVKPSLLGDNGKVLHSDNRVLVTEDIWRQASRTEIRELIQRGFKVAPFPLVDPAKQGYKFNHEEGHADGHGKIVKGLDGKYHLLVAKSYANQRGGVRGDIRSAARTICAEDTVINDRHLPPLSFNLIQLPDLSVVMTDSATELEEVLVQLVGAERVHKTCLIEYLPERTFGSILCLTNTALNLPEMYYTSNVGQYAGV